MSNKPDELDLILDKIPAYSDNAMRIKKEAKAQILAWAKSRENKIRADQRRSGMAFIHANVNRLTNDTKLKKDLDKIVQKELDRLEEL